MTTKNNKKWQCHYMPLKSCCDSAEAPKYKSNCFWNSLSDFSIFSWHVLLWRKKCFHIVSPNKKMKTAFYIKLHLLIVCLQIPSQLRRKAQKLPKTIFYIIFCILHSYLNQQCQFMHSTAFMCWQTIFTSSINFAISFAANLVCES